MRTGYDALVSVKDYVWQALGEPWEVRLADEQGAFERPFAMVWPQGEEVMEARGSLLHPAVAQPFQVACYPLPLDTPEESLRQALAVQELLWMAFRRGVGYLSSPAAPTVTTGVAGTLLAGTYFYRVTAYNRSGETLPSAAVSVAVSAGDVPVLSWAPVAGAVGYRVYRGPSADTTLRLATVIPATFSDLGEVAPNPPPPPLRNRARAGRPGRVPFFAYDAVPVLTTPSDPLPSRGQADYLTVRDLTFNRARDTEDPTLWTVNCSVRLGWRRSAGVPSETSTVESVTARPA